MISASLTLAAAILGLNVHQSSTVGPDATKGAALGIVRIDANWVDAEKTQGNFDFTLFDQVANAAQARGLAVLAVLGYGPAWASRGDTLGDGSNNDVPNPGTYAAFVTAAVNHLKDRVEYFELWNEPNLTQFFEGTPQDYLANVLAPGSGALHAACASCKVVAPALATVGTNYATWLDAVLAGAMDKIDIVSGHDYAHFPQDSPGVGGTSDSFFNKLESHRIVKIGTVVAYEGPLSFKEVMNAHGATQPFWITESGIEATYGDNTAEAAQTLYYRRVLESMLTRPWWQATIFYEGFDVPPPAQFHFGVCVDDSATSLGYDEKPVMALLRKAAQNQAVFGGTGTDCNDGLDNDGDGTIDSADPDCATSTNEGLPPVDAGAPDAGDAETDSGGGGCSCNTSANVPSAALLVLMLALLRRWRRPSSTPWTI
jgi:MYXO-CTERM domain-containing protein